MRFVVLDADWTGNYVAQVRRRPTDTDVLATLTVTTNLINSSTDTEFILTLSEADSILLPAGKYYWDLQDTDVDLTRLTGEVAVSQDVTRV